MKKFTYLFAVLVLAAGLAAQEGRGPDGRYHDNSPGGDGRAQPEMCDNSFKNSHPCRCSRATSCDPKAKNEHPSGGPGSGIKDDMPRCATYCRTEACRCVTECGS